MKFIHTSDWHLGKTLEVNSRLEEQEMFLNDFVNIVEENNIDMGILCVPRINAQKVCDVLVNGGVKGIWNFAPIDLHVPGTVKVENVHLSESLLTLVYQMNE